MIIAVDFDGTIVEHKYPAIGKELPFAIEKIKQNSRIYSRKQMTWFKRDEEIRWFHPEQETEILSYLR